MACISAISGTAPAPESRLRENHNFNEGHVLIAGSHHVANIPLTWSRITFIQETEVLCMTVSGKSRCATSLRCSKENTARADGKKLIGKGVESTTKFVCTGESSGGCEKKS